MTQENEPIQSLIKVAIRRSYADGVRAAVDLIREYHNKLPLVEVLTILKSLATKHENGEHDDK